MPEPRKSKKDFASQYPHPEERNLEYDERRDRLRRILVNRRAKSTKDTNESGPESATQDNLNDASNHENEPTKSINEEAPSENSKKC